MKNYYLALMVSALLTINVYAEDVEEVVVTASLKNQTVSDLQDPLHVVDGEDVAEVFSCDNQHRLHLNHTIRRGLCGCKSTNKTAEKAAAPGEED